MAGDRKATLVAVLKDGVSGPAKHIQAEITGIGVAVGKANSFITGIGQGLGQEFFRGLTDAVRTAAEAIPHLLDAGNDYLAQLHQIQLETGMTAEQTSLLVGTLKNLGVPADDLSTLFARLGANIGRNEGQFRALGVATRDSNGGLLSSYQIVENLRHAVQSHGESLLSTAAAQELFGRSAFNLLPFLQATDDQLAISSDNVRRWGGVVSQAAIDGARGFENTLASLRSGITDIGVNIAAAVDPYLRAFVDSFARFIQAHLQQIVNFAVAVVNTVVGFISGLFGITDALDLSAVSVEASTAKASAGTDNFGKVLKGAGTGSDAFTLSINRQIKAIDAHVHALEQAAERRRAIQERQRLAESLAAAQSQLADLKGNSPFLGGLSAAEQALAVQKHAQDIIDAEKNVRDQRQAIGDFEADQKDRAERELLNREKDRLQESLAAHKAANADILQSGLRMGAGLQSSIGTTLTNLGIKSQEFGKTAAASFKTGVDAAKSFLDILLGAQTVSERTGEPVRTGGLLGAISSVGGAVGGLADVFGKIGDALAWVDRTGQPAADFLNSVSRAIVDFGLAVHDFLISIGIPLPNPRGHDQGSGGGFATGGFFPATAGGTWARLAEGGEDEYALPASKLREMLGHGHVGDGGGHSHDIYMDGKKVAEAVSSRQAFALIHSPVSSLPSGSF